MAAVAVGGGDGGTAVLQVTSAGMAVVARQERRLRKPNPRVPCRHNAGAGRVI
jgi:hypothetical protein